MRTHTLTMRACRLALLAFAVLLNAPPFGAQPHQAYAFGATTTDAVLDWNAIAVGAVRGAGKLQAEGEVYLAYVQAAVYDATTAIEGGYQQYRTSLSAPAGASPSAAAAAAAHRVLVTYFPEQSAALDVRYAATLSALPADAHTSDGVQVGERAAAAIIALRAGDVLSGTGGYTFGSGPGVWTLPTPDNPATAPQTPWLRLLTPFMLQSPSQFRADPPPDLTSPEYAAELNEVKAYGGQVSLLRTPEMAAVARFWTANVIDQYNLLLRSVAGSRAMNIERTARLLAMGDMVVADAGIACWDSKYNYSFWRPVQAIRGAGLDGNPMTEPDASWTPFLAPTPNHPEYPSAHGCLTSALAHTLQVALGTNRIDVDIAGVNPATGAFDPTYTRHFERVADVTREIVDARVWAGYHFRDSVVEGVNIGRKVAHFDTDRYFLPVA